MAGPRREYGDDKRVMTALRIPPDDLAEIDRRAKKHELSRTEFLIRCALGQILDRAGAEAMLKEHEKRIERLERLAFGED